MIRLNFIPENLRRTQGGLLDKGLAGIPAEIVIGTCVALVGLILSVHISFGVFTVLKIVENQSLEGQWTAMSGDKKAVDDVMEQMKTLNAKLGALKAITSVDDISWSSVFKELSMSVRQGIWVREIRYEGKTLTASGGAVSKPKQEMIPVYQLVGMLKEKPNFKQYFVSLEIESIQQRGDSLRPITDFVLKAKRK